MLSLLNLVARFINAFKGFVNSIISAISKFAVVLINILPESPFQSVMDTISKNETFSNLEWVIPFSTFLSIGIAWTSAIAVYYVISVGLRWVKAIE